MTGTYEKFLKMPYKVFPCFYCPNEYFSENIRDWHEKKQCRQKKHIIWRVKFQTIYPVNIIPVSETKSEERIWKKPALTCKFCKKTHTRVQHLHNHLKSCERRQLSKHRCECNKRFSTLSNLSRHKKKFCKLKL